MIYEVMRHCRNFFPCGEAMSGVFSVENGGLDLPFIKEGQFFLIEGSSFCDGVYVYPSECLTDETFEGWITPLAPPKAFLELVEEIEQWQEKFGGVDSTNMSPFNSESFNGYSYSKNTGGNAEAGTSSWKKAYRDRLNEWRKL